MQKKRIKIPTSLRYLENHTEAKTIFTRHQTSKLKSQQILHMKNQKLSSPHFPPKAEDIPFSPKSNSPYKNACTIPQLILLINLFCNSPHMDIWILKTIKY